MRGQFLRDIPEPQTQNRLGVGLEHLTGRKEYLCSTGTGSKTEKVCVIW